MTDDEFMMELRIGVMGKHQIDEETFNSIFECSKEYIFTLVHNGFTVRQVLERL